MGATYTTVEVTNLQKTITPYSNEFLVDTGAIDCLVPSKILHQLGIEVEKTKTYEVADGRTVKYPVGFARIKFMGEETISQVIFGPDDCEPLLGVVALENTGYGVDPITKTLKKFNAIPLK